MKGTNIKLVRVDSRLLHATVQLNWNQFINADQVWVVDPHYVKDPFIANVMQLCLPKTMKVNFYSVEQFILQLQKNEDMKVMIIFPNLQIVEQAVKAGFRVSEIQLPYPASRVLLKKLSEYFSPEDIDRIRYIQSQGIQLFFQTTPFDNKDYSIFKK
ncbi:PTS sugar transporter subunit IIB [Merdibacter massiliensis]|uniref:PTS sugar transporter subunit IIB n=1 Tax=Merdibacter massiliensis TaxID=1871030 RepID=UPI00096A8D01|nr:PTS sugar transporter subunit IIB [Merdibacter massiliensis]